MVGKYTVLADAYLSVVKALQHASMATNRKLEIRWIEASDLEETTKVTCEFGLYRDWRRLRVCNDPLGPARPHPAHVLRAIPGRVNLWRVDQWWVSFTSCSRHRHLTIAFPALLQASDPDAHHKAWEQLQTAHGILVPGGFGNR